MVLLAVGDKIKRSRKTKQKKIKIRQRSNNFCLRFLFILNCACNGEKKLNLLLETEIPFLSIFGQGLPRPMALVAYNSRRPKPPQVFIHNLAGVFVELN
jgi:hypothetical protein